jgi:hypothetical protein
MSKRIAFPTWLAIWLTFMTVPIGLVAENETMLEKFRAGPMANVEEIIFAARQLGKDGHWYANFGYYANDPNRKTYGDGGKLYRLNLRTGKLTTLLDDPKGGVRDPQVHYDGQKILFSYRKGGECQYHLYEINIDGTDLKQLTDGPFDDIEPSYLADGGIVFVSSRCNRWVNCWLTQVAVLHRCDADGKNIRALSSNNEHDNTPWPLADGRVLYTRWEYVDRSQVHFHHLWTANPDGTSQMIWFGNMFPGITMIDAKPIPGSDKVVASFSPGHGRREHDGTITVVDPLAGPDEPSSAKRISKTPDYRDPWAFSENNFLAAKKTSLVLMDENGVSQEIFKLSEADILAGLECHEPRPLQTKAREKVISSRIRLDEKVGKMILADVYDGRNMEGVQRGEIKKLLVLETLPMPIHYTGGMEPISYGGTFTLERILGTVPVEKDGSAYFEVPAMRSVFFVALDENDLAVKRMQSFTSVQPGEVMSCTGCHEHRTQTPQYAFQKISALRHAPAKIEPITDVPDVIDFPRDIQPIFDRHCLKCHDYDHRNTSRVFLTGDRGPMFSDSYFTLTARSQVADGRNKPKSNYAPRTLGSSASPLMNKLDQQHYDVEVSPLEKKKIRLWLDSGAAYPGTYAALGTGSVGNYAENQPSREDLEWPSTQAAIKTIQQRCDSCHAKDFSLPLHVSDNRSRHPWQLLAPDDPRRRLSRNLVFNLTRPEKSMMLLAPLSRDAGGFGFCTNKTGVSDVFSSTDDADYKTILAAINDAAMRLDEIKRFDMPGFRPRTDWVREMKRYGILPETLDPNAPIDVYAVERKYWESLWYSPQGLLSQHH